MTGVLAFCFILILEILSSECLAPMYYGFDRPVLEYELPPLPYGYHELEPFIDGETLKVHYRGHHEKYKSNLNDMLKEWHKQGKEATRISIIDMLKNSSVIPSAFRQKFINNAGGYLNHAFYFELMSPNKDEVDREPYGKLAAEITNTFQNFRKFKARFSDLAIKLFGSGYVWLCRSYQNGRPSQADDSELVIVSTQNQNVPLSSGLYPILVIDVWEHAYYLKHKNLRTRYVKDWWNIINWDAVNDLDDWWKGIFKHDEL